MCVCVRVFAHTGVEWHIAKTFPHRIKYLQDQQWLQYQVLEKKLNIENQHFMLNWTKSKASHRQTVLGSGVQVQWPLRKMAGNLHYLHRNPLLVNQKVFRSFLNGCIVEWVHTYSSLRLGRLSRASVLMVVSLLWLRILQRKEINTVIKLIITLFTTLAVFVISTVYYS